MFWSSEFRVWFRCSSQHSGNQMHRLLSLIAGIPRFHQGGVYRRAKFSAWDFQDGMCPSYQQEFHTEFGSFGLWEELEKDVSRKLLVQCSLAAPEVECWAARMRNAIFNLGRGYMIYIYIIFIYNLYIYSIFTYYIILYYNILYYIIIYYIYHLSSSLYTVQVYRVTMQLSFSCRENSVSIYDRQ